MKQLKMLGLAAVAAAAALTALPAPGASATTLEVGGVTKNSSVTIQASLKAGTSTLFRDTFGISTKTCTESVIAGSTASPYTGSTLTAAVTTLSFSQCTIEPVVVHNAGTLHIAHIAGTTNGTVTSSGIDFTTSGPFGTLTCKTGEGTHLGTLTGVKEGHATIDINATLSCSGISKKWIATYTITSPTGLGVTA